MFAMIDRVAEQSTGNDWSKATSMGIYAFLSIYSYSISKQEHQQAEMKRQYDMMRNRHTV